MPNIRDEKGLAQALVDGLLAECHFLELKREVVPGRAANLETARDLASLSVDGGEYIIGVDEKTQQLHAVPLAGLAERIEQVCLSVADPPLVLRFQAIPASGRPGMGYLVVTVPPSPQAPHMVDHSYWARGDRTKLRLSDAEVVRLHERRRSWERRAIETLDALVAADPVPEQDRRLAHLFLAALPVPGRTAMVLDLVGDTDWQGRLVDLVHRRAVAASGFNPDDPGGFAPNLGQPQGLERRAAGWAVTTYGFGPGRSLLPDAAEDHLLELELDENGELRLFCGRASYLSRSDSGNPLAFELLMIGLFRQLLGVVSAISESARYLGSWDFAVAVQGLRGCTSAELAQDFMSSCPVFSADAYREGTRASIEELRQRPGEIANRLFGRLVRSLGSTGRPQLVRLLGDVDPPRSDGVP